MPYEFVSLTEVPDLTPQMALLSNVAFAEYEGAPEVDAEFCAWYLRRPGSGPEVCVGAVCDGQLAAMVLVALQDLCLGGEVVRCGLVDTVSTHPDHRRQGLAHRLMEMAHDVMRARGAEAAVLYTNPENHPYQFYGRLGYFTRARAKLLTGTRPQTAGVCTVRPYAPAEAGIVQDLVNGTYGSYEGFARLEGDLWCWHREARPADLPVTVLVAETDGQVRGTVAVAATEVLLHGQRQTLGFVSDLVAPDAAWARELLAAAPVADLAALYDQKAPPCALLETLGFAGQLGEVAMVLPLNDHARKLIHRDPTPWYVMVESVVGV